MITITTKVLRSNPEPDLLNNLTKLFLLLNLIINKVGTLIQLFVIFREDKYSH